MGAGRVPVSGERDVRAAMVLGVRRDCIVPLQVEFQIARSNGTIRKLIAQYKKYALLVIDPWLLYPLKETEARDILEIVQSRYK